MLKRKPTGKPLFNIVAGVAISLALTACCSDGKLPDVVQQAIQIPPVAELIVQPAMAVNEISETTGLSPFNVQLDASGSYDPDGFIVRYDWDFDSDGTFDVLDGNAIENYTYRAASSMVSATEVPAGSFTATVKVYDNDDLTDSTTGIIHLNELNFIPPTAVASAAVDATNLLLVHYDGTASFDTDGTIEQYDWDMDNDGTFELADAGATPDNLFASFGVHTVGLQVTDDDELTDQTTVDVTLTEEANIPPVADVVPNPAAGNAPGLNVTFDASGSSDADGTIVQYDWDMDNNGTFEITDGGTTQTYSYSGGGIYTVWVRVTDDDGATDSATTFVDVNDPPVAVVTANPMAGDAPDLPVDYDASGSFDTDGTIVQYDWDMDNNGTFEVVNGGVTQSTVYPVGGLYTVGVQVTDDDGARDTATVTVDVNNPPVAEVVVDSMTLGPTSWEVVFSGADSTDSDGTIVQYDWDMDNNGTYEILNGGVTQNADYTVDGTYTVGIRVTDNDGAQDTDTVNVVILTPPIADLTASDFGDYCIGWDASASYDPLGGSIVSFDWDMDNNGSFEFNGSDVEVECYQGPGTYTVGVRVTDNDGLTDFMYFSFTLP